MAAFNAAPNDPRLAMLVLTAVIDYHLYQSEARRQDIDYVDGVFTLFRHASRLSPDASSQEGVRAGD